MAKRRPRVSALSIVIALLVLGAAGAIAWASITYDAEQAARAAAAEPTSPKVAAKAPVEDDDKSEALPKQDGGKSEAPPKQDGDKSETPPAPKIDPNNLPPAPDPKLVEETPLGPVPKIADDGRTALSVYARPHSSDGRPQIAIIIAGLGLNGDTTAAAIDELPGLVTLAFSPYGEDLQRLVNNARSKGHEILLEIPMEPRNYPRDDPGPNTLLVTAPARVNVAQTRRSLAQVTGYVGVMNFMGGRYVGSEIALRPVFQVFKQSGLMFIDAETGAESKAVSVADGMALPRVFADRWIDDKPSKAAIEAKLRELEKIAFDRGHAVGIAHLHPVTANILARWSREADGKGLDLAPISALVNKQAAR